MQDILEMKLQNVRFEKINEETAKKIFNEKYSFDELIQYGVLFEKYNREDKKNQFVNLDFAQLYFLAELDSKICKVLMAMALEIEAKIKHKIIVDFKNDAEPLLIEYYNIDHEYLETIYDPEFHNDLRAYLNEGQKLFDLSMFQFLQVIGFGTLERFIGFLYSKKDYEHLLSNWKFDLYDIVSVRRIRNIVAHNGSIMCKLIERADKKNLKNLAILGKNGIKHKTLTTNMSREIINELVGFFKVYFSLCEKAFYAKQFELLLSESKNDFNVLFEKNGLLISSRDFVYKVFYLFMHKTIDSE